jgi:hypothetical protein
MCSCYHGPMRPLDTGLQIRSSGSILDCFRYVCAKTNFQVCPSFPHMAALCAVHTPGSCVSELSEDCAAHSCLACYWTKGSDLGSCELMNLPTHSKKLSLGCTSAYMLYQHEGIISKLVHILKKNKFRKQAIRAVRRQTLVPNAHLAC